MLSEDIQREWRFNQILEELNKIAPNRMTKNELIEKLGNEIAEDVLYSDVKFLTNIRYLRTSFYLDTDFTTNIVEQGITALTQMSPEKRFPRRENRGIIFKVKRDWLGITFFLVGVILIVYIFWGVFIY